MPPAENLSEPSVVRRIPTVKGQTSVWRECCPCRGRRDEARPEARLRHRWRRRARARPGARPTPRRAPAGAPRSPARARAGVLKGSARARPGPVRRRAGSRLPDRRARRYGRVARCGGRAVGGPAPRPCGRRFRARRCPARALPRTASAQRGRGVRTAWRRCPPVSRVLLVCGRAPGRALSSGRFGRDSMGAAWVGPLRWKPVGWGTLPPHSPQAVDRSGRRQAPPGPCVEAGRGSRSVTVGGERCGERSGGRPGVVCPGPAERGRGMGPDPATGVEPGPETGPEQVPGRRRPLRGHVPTAFRAKGDFGRSREECFGREAGERSPGRARERTGVKQGVQGGGYPVARLCHALRMAENHRSVEVGPIDARTSPPKRPRSRVAHVSIMRRSPVADP